MSLLHTQISWLVSQQWFNHFPSGGSGATSEHTTATAGMEQENPGCQCRHLSLFFCCVSLLSHANENVSTFQRLGTSCRCVSDAQLNEWSKLETQTPQLSSHPMEQNSLNTNRKRDTWTWVKRESFTPLTSETHYQALLLKPKGWKNSEKDELFIKKMQVFSHITKNLKNKI